MTAPGCVVVAGESIAGLTTARELRGRGYAGRLTVIGAEPEGAYSRPPLSKDALRGVEALDLRYSYDDLDLSVIRSPAVALDVTKRVVTTAAGDTVGYDALVIATGAEPRRLAGSRQGELVLRTVGDADRLRERMSDATSALVLGAGFLGMEVASACARQGMSVTVVDVTPPLLGVLGEYMSDLISQRASENGLRFIPAGGAVGLVGSPVRGVLLPNGTTLTAEVVVTCAGDVPATGWLAGTGLADHVGVPIDAACRTSVPNVYAAGDVAYLRDGPGRRAPFWSNAVAQGKVAAASVLGEPPACSPSDDYFWTEVLGLAIKVVGPLPVTGEPTTIEGSVADDDAVLRWTHPDGRSTVVAWGRRVPVPQLRAMAGADPSASTAER